MPNGSAHPASRPIRRPNRISAAVTDIENAHAGAGFVTSDASYQTLPSWSNWTAFATDTAGSVCT